MLRLERRVLADGPGGIATAQQPCCCSCSGAVDICCIPRGRPLVRIPVVHIPEKPPRGHPLARMNAELPLRAKTRPPQAKQEVLRSRSKQARRDMQIRPPMLPREGLGRAARLPVTFSRIALLQIAPRLTLRKAQHPEDHPRLQVLPQDPVLYLPDPRWTVRTDPMVQLL